MSFLDDFTEALVNLPFENAMNNAMRSLDAVLKPGGALYPGKGATPSPNMADPEALRSLIQGRPFWSRGRIPVTVRVPQEFAKGSFGTEAYCWAKFLWDTTQA